MQDKFPLLQLIILLTSYAVMRFHIIPMCYFNSVIFLLQTLKKEEQFKHLKSEINLSVLPSFNSTNKIAPIKVMPEEGRSTAGTKQPIEKGWQQSSKTQDLFSFYVKPAGTDVFWFLISSSSWVGLFSEHSHFILPKSNISYHCIRLFSAVNMGVLTEAVHLESKY